MIEYISKYDNFIMVDSDDALRRFKSRIEEHQRVAFDSETGYKKDVPGIVKVIGGNKNNYAFGWSFSDGVSAWWLPDKGNNYDIVKDVLENDKIEKRAHNAIYDIHMAMNLGMGVRGKIVDTMMYIHLVDEGFTPKGSKKQSKKLKDLAYHFLGDDAHELEELVDEARVEIAKEKGIKKSEVSYLYVNEKYPVLMKDYACADTLYTYKITDILEQEMTVQQLWDAYKNDIDAMWAILNIERTGHKIDRRRAEDTRDAFGMEAAQLQADIYNILNKGFNIESANEFVEAVTGKYKFDWRWLTDSDEYATDAATIDMAVSEFPETKEVMDIKREYDKKQKIINVFNNILDNTDNDDRVHCDYFICPTDFGNGSTVTGRLSSANPNLQNLHKKDENVRSLFIPTPGYVWVEFDYSQQEYCLLGHYANDPAFQQFIHEGKDIHQATASMIFNVPYDEVTKEMRDKAKAINFGLVYGLGNPAFAKASGEDIDDALCKYANRVIFENNLKPWNVKSAGDVLHLCKNEREENAVKYLYDPATQQMINNAKGLKAKYFNRFPSIQQFLRDVTAAAKRRGWIKMWNGRRRHFKDPQREGYKAPNSLIQGGCGCIIKQKLYEADKHLENNPSRLLNTVHDSIIGEFRYDELYLIDEVKAIMENLDFRVPMRVDVEYSLDNWFAKKEYKGVEALEQEIKERGWM